MSWWEDVNTTAMAYKCPYCQVGPGIRCRAVVSGKPSRYLHEDRTRPIRDTIRDAYQEGQADVLDAFDEPTNWFSHMLDRRRTERNTP